MANSPVDALKDSLHRTMRAPGGFGALTNTVPRVLEEASAIAGAAFAAESTGVVAAFVEALVAACGGSVVLVIIVIALALVIGFRINEFLLYKIADHMPFGIGSSQIRGFIKGVFSPLDNVENYVVGRLLDALQELMSAVWLMLHVAVLAIVGDTSALSPNSEKVAMQRLQAEYNDLYRKYNQVEHQVKTLQDQIAGVGTLTIDPPAPSPTAPIGPGTVTIIHEPLPGNILARIKRLETREVSIVHNLNVLHGDFNTLAHNESVVNQKVAAIEAALGGIRATQYGVQSTMTEFGQLIGGVQHELGQLAPQVDTSVRQLLLMKPLEQLLYLGQPGINTLKKLENDPCQCPSYPDLPSDQSEALAVLGFISG